MGDHREQFVDLSTRPEHAEVRASQVRDWLRDVGWTVTQEGVDDWLLGCAADAIGPTAFASFPDLTATVAVVAKPELWIAGDSTAGPCCPSCGVRDEDPWDRLQGWDGPNTEPTVVCVACRHTALLGEWDVSSSVAYGAVGVVLDVHTLGADVEMKTFADALLRVLRSGARRALGLDTFPPLMTHELGFGRD